MSEEVKEVTEKLFTVTEKINGKEVTKDLLIKKPSGQEGVEAQKVYAKAWNEALKNGAPLRAQVDTLLVERGLWSDTKEKELTSQAKVLQKEIDRLNKGGISLAEGRGIGLAVRNLRYDFNRLALEKSVLDNNTVEGQAEIAKINYLISVCTVYNITKKRVYKDLEQFYNESNEKTAIEASNAFMSFVYNLNADYEKEYPENKFLLKYKFINDKLQVLNDDGKPYDPETNLLINEFGQWVNDKNEFINRDGDVVNEDGTLKVEKCPFLDEHGNPVE